MAADIFDTVPHGVEHILDEDRNDFIIDTVRTDPGRALRYVAIHYDNSRVEYTGENIKAFVDGVHTVEEYTRDSLRQRTEYVLDRQRDAHHRIPMITSTLLSLGVTGVLTFSGVPLLFSWAYGGIIGSIPTLVSLAKHPETLNRDYLLREVYKGEARLWQARKLLTESAEGCVG